ncbi:MAG TPA: SET domain-containing protein-lysine N-methyltransferase [Candidatus Moranbacteria bacterium]|nr:SET domain-containing protein-lysine N-methyltransferase [Candidatus Moranbacteria bacterium]HSA08428.1 SET domain-containing protein-lysine N-methyltransferase [Candidatus Moranbacteria bacterium]
MRNKEKRRPFSWMNPKLEIRNTKKYGKGVYAKKDIKKEEMLFVIGGYILTIDDDNKLRGSLADKPIDLSDRFLIGPTKISDLDLLPQHWMNHSCNPNAGFRGQIFVVAMRKIRKGEEITFDYAMVMYPDKSGKSNCYFRMKCECGSKNCRGYITEDDWEIPELQKKYDGYFQWFIQNEIEKNKKKKKKLSKNIDKSYQSKPAPWERKN